MPTWQVGEVVLDLYEVVGAVQTGGMGVVYRVWNTDLAVKVPRPELVTSARGRAAFESEAESWVELGSHPNVVGCAYVRRVDDAPCVFAEWVDGGTLADAVRTRRLYEGGERAALGRILDVAIQIAWGIDHAHEHGLVHQDVKPANVMLGRDRTAKVTDFGLAKARASAGESREAAPGGSLLVSYGGRTPAYCSPEQESAGVGGDILLSRATDVWSWAVTVLEAFVGGPPTTAGPGAGEALEELVRQRARPADGLPPLPDELVTLVRWCLRPDPASRPSRLALVADELSELYRHLLREPYERTQPSAARLLADGLSNQALSLLDLGRPEAAEDLWRQAIEADPHHPHATYNRGLWRWRTGRTSDAQLIADLEEMRGSHPDDWIDEYLLGVAQLERGDVDSARGLLDDARRRAPSAPDVAVATELVAQARAWSPPVILGDHGEVVDALAVSADGRFVASVARDHSQPPDDHSDAGQIRVWDRRTGRHLRTLDASDRGVHALAWRADGRALACCGEDRGVQWWDVGTGAHLGRIAGHGSTPDAVALTPDGRLVVSADRAGAVLLASAETGRLVRRLQDDQQLGSHYDGAVAVTVDGQHVVRWEPSTHRLRVWQLPTGYLHNSLQLARGAVVALSADGGVALVAADGRLELWNPLRGERIRSVRLHLPLSRPVAVAGDGRSAVEGTAGGLRLWELATGRCLRTLTGHEGSVAAVAIDGTGRLGVSSGWDRTVRVWELGSAHPPAPWSHARPRGADELTREADLVSQALTRAAGLEAAGALSEALAVLRTARAVPGYERDRELVERWARLGRAGDRSGLRGAWQVAELTRGRTHREPLALSPDGRLCLSDAGFSVWVPVEDVRTGEVVQTLGPHGDPVRCATFAPDGQTVVTGGEDRQVRVWDVSTGQCRHVLEGHDEGVHGVAVGPDGRQAVSGGWDAQVIVWDIVTGRRLHRLTAHEHPVRTVSLSADGDVAFSADGDGLVRAWDVRGGSEICVLPGRRGRVTEYATSADGRIVLTVTDPIEGIPGPWVRVWDTTTPGLQDLGELRTLLRGHVGKVLSLAVSPTGRVALGACEDGTVRRWDLESGECTGTLEGHAGAVTVLTTIGDDRFALSGGEDGTIRVWDVRTGGCVRVIQAHPGAVRSMLVSADARIVVSDSEDTTRTWELDWDYDVPDASGGGERG